MAKPINTVVIGLHGKVTVMKTNEIPWGCKGTSVFKANKIKEEIENDNNH